MQEITCCHSHYSHYTAEWNRWGKPPMGGGGKYTLLLSIYYILLRRATGAWAREGVLPCPSVSFVKFSLRDKRRNLLDRKVHLVQHCVSYSGHQDVPEKPHRKWTQQPSPSLLPKQVASKLISMTTGHGRSVHPSLMANSHWEISPPLNYLIPL